MTDPRQGDYIPGVDRLFVRDDNGTVTEVSTPLGVVIITQCCDLARPESGNIPVAAAVVELSGSRAENARTGRSPRYAGSAQLAADQFVDFGVIGAISASVLSSSQRRALSTTRDRLFFQSRIARRFGRFAYPDDAQPFVRKIQKRLRSKAGLTTSSLGTCIDRIQTIRVEADWDPGPPWELTIVFVLHEGELPTVSQAATGMGTKLSVADAADRVARLGAGSSGLDAAWLQLAEAVVQEARDDKSASAHISDVVVEVLEESEFDYYRFRRSADLDVDDLSETT